MSNNARVRIEVDDSAIKLLQQNATALYRELSEQAKAQNKDIQAISKSIDEQIKLISQRNLQLSREANSKLAQDLGAGLVDRETFNRRVARNANDYRLRTKSLNEVREMYMRDFGYSNMIREDATALFDQFKKGHTSGDFNEYISRRIADYNRNSKQLYLDRVAGAKDSFMAGEITRSEYRDRLNSASLERKHDDAIYRVLKEIAENTKSNTKNISTDDFIRTQIDQIILKENAFNKIMQYLTSNFSFQIDATELDDFKKRFKAQFNETDETKLTELSKKLIMKGLVFEQIIAQNKLGVDDNQVKTYLDNYYKTTNQPINEYLNNKDKFEEIRNIILEEKTTQ